METMAKMKFDYHNQFMLSKATNLEEQIAAEMSL